MRQYITDNIEISSDSDRKYSDEGNTREQNSDEENFIEENKYKTLIYLIHFLRGYPPLIL